MGRKGKFCICHQLLGEASLSLRQLRRKGETADEEDSGEDILGEFHGEEASWEDPCEDVPGTTMA